VTYHRKTARLMSRQAQDNFFSAGQRLTRSGRRPLGRAGECLQGFDGLAGVPSTKQQRRNDAPHAHGLRWLGT
jgi:hypothetical protein